MLIPSTVWSEHIVTENVTVKSVPIPEVGVAKFPVFNNWKMYTSAPNKSPAVTVKFVSKSNKDPISFSLTFIPNKIGKNFSKQENADLVYKLALPYVKTSVENKVNLKSFDATMGLGIYASFNEKKYQNIDKLPKGEFSSITVGQISHQLVVMPFSILTNGTDSHELEAAKVILESFSISKQK